MEVVRLRLRFAIELIVSAGTTKKILTNCLRPPGMYYFVPNEDMCKHHLNIKIAEANDWHPYIELLISNNSKYLFSLKEDDILGTIMLLSDNAPIR